MGALDGNVAIVAGASRGIGKGIAIELAAQGAFVYATGRTLERRAGKYGSLLETMAAMEQLGGTGAVIACDHNSEDAVSQLFDRIRADHGRVDVLVNSVFNSPDFNPSIGVKFWDLPVSMWHDVVDIGTRTAYVTAVFAAPLMIERGERGPGLIANISGRGAQRYRYNVPYGVGKAALDKMTHDMAVDLREHNVAVVSLWPNLTRTEWMDQRAIESGKQLALGDLDQFETPRFQGRAVAALATDPEVVTTRSGKAFWVADLADEYDFDDEHGRRPHLPQ